jgi:hypothetical protein
MGVARRGEPHRVWAARQLEIMLDEWTPVIAEQLLSRVDLTSLVLKHVDLDKVVDAVDLEAAIGRVDMVALVEDVITAMDLPAIIRESSRSVSSETVRGARMAAVSVDDAISKGIERHLPRWRRGRGMSPKATP